MKKVYILFVFIPLLAESQLWDIDRYSLESSISMGFEKFHNPDDKLLALDIGGNKMNLNPSYSGFYMPIDLVNVGYIIDYRFSVTLGTGFEFSGKSIENTAFTTDVWRHLGENEGKEYVPDVRTENKSETWRFHTVCFPLEFQYRMFTRGQKNDLSLSFNPVAVFFVGGGFNFKLFTGAKKLEEKPIYQYKYYGDFWSPITNKIEPNYDHWTVPAKNYIKANKSGVAMLAKVGVFIPRDGLGGSSIFIKYERDLKARFEMKNGQNFFRLSSITFGYTYSLSGDKFAGYEDKLH